MKTKTVHTDSQTDRQTDRQKVENKTYSDQSIKRGGGSNKRGVCTFSKFLML